MPTDPLSSPLWGITCYFNSTGARSRLANYRTFHERLSVPLVTVELSTDGKFHLTTADADILIQVQSPHILWQKERLLNIALKSVPTECSSVAWLDCDVVFEQPDWPFTVRHALQQFPVIQLFSELIDLPCGALPEDAGSLSNSSPRVALPLCLAQGASREDVFCKSGGSLQLGYTAGHAWAARRDLLDDHGFYDARILGSGNKFMISAAFGRMRDTIAAYHLNAREAEHYLAWASRHLAAVQANVGHLDGRVFHLWHGDLQRRNYATRHNRFRQFDFDPYCDIALNADACWQWNSDKPDLHQYLIDYFQSRHND